MDAFNERQLPWNNRLILSFFKRYKWSGGVADYVEYSSLRSRFSSSQGTAFNDYIVPTPEALCFDLNKYFGLNWYEEENTCNVTRGRQRYNWRQLLRIFRQFHVGEDKCSVGVGSRSNWSFGVPDDIDIGSIQFSRADVLTWWNLLITLLIWLNLIYS